jgi:hypothetical protein
MEVFALHLEVNQRLQEVASFKRNKYFPEEIDLALNKAQYRLLEKGVEANFQSNQVNLSTVSALVQPNKNFELIIPSSTDDLYEASVLNSYTPVPEDLYWTINTRTEVLTDPLNCNTPPSLGTKDVIEYVAIIGYPNVVGVAPYYKNLKIQSIVNGVTKDLYVAPTELSNGIETVQGRYFITQNILESFYRNKTIRVYWERYRNNYQKGRFFIVSNQPLGTVLLSFTGVTPFVASAQATTYTVFDKGAVPNLKSKLLQISSSRIEQQDTIYQSLFQNDFFRPKAQEPLVTQTLDYFTVYRDKNFIVTGLIIDYIRKPRTISLSLNQTCELAPNTHPKLIDLAVEILRLDTKDQAYNASVQDTELRS